MNEQVKQAAAAGVSLLNRESTLIPSNLAQQVVVLVQILHGLATGRLVLAEAQQKPVESQVDAADAAPTEGAPGDTRNERRQKR